MVAIIWGESISGMKAVPMFTASKTANTSSASTPAMTTILCFKENRSTFS